MHACSQFSDSIFRRQINSPNDSSSDGNSCRIVEIVKLVWSTMRAYEWASSNVVSEMRLVDGKSRNFPGKVSLFDNLYCHDVRFMVWTVRFFIFVYKSEYLFQTIFDNTEKKFEYDITNIFCSLLIRGIFWILIKIYMRMLCIFTRV